MATDRITQHIDRLASLTGWPYLPGGPSAAEPAAWTTLALVCHDRLPEARQAARWLATLQQPGGAVGVSAQQPTPRWPTSLAIRAWHAVDAARADATTRTPPEFSAEIDAAIAWALQTRGNTGPRKPQVGHDTTIAGWSWAENTHSWLEPTCFFVDALRLTGHGNHPRTRDGVRMVVDRLLPVGGCNYGNTFALGQMLLPHVQSTGIALATLAPEGLEDIRIEKSLDYLDQAVGAETPTASLSFALAGLAAHGRAPQEAGEWIEQRLARQQQHDAEPSAQRLALLLYAAAQVNNSRSNESVGVA